MKRILVPTDFSPQAEKALEVAAQLARRYDSEIVLVHMLELPMQLVNPVGGTGTNDLPLPNYDTHNLPEVLFFVKLAKKRFAKVLEKPWLKGIRIKERIEPQKAFDGIMEISREHNCDLIVMGSHGASGVKEVFIGSNTEKVVRHSDIPVLVIKNKHPEFIVENFVFATDCEAKDKHSLLEAKSLAEKINAKMHIVYINTANDFKTTEEAENCLKDFVAEAGLQNHSLNVYNDVSVEKGILNFAKSIDAGLIGISTHGRKGLAHFFNGSISEDLVNHSNRPVITFKLKKQKKSA